MILMLPLFLLLVAPTITLSNEVVAKEIDGYFNNKTTVSIDTICQTFLNDFGVEVCQLEGGTRRKNSRGFEEEANELTISEASDGWLDLVLKFTSKSSSGNKGYLQMETCANEYTRVELDLNYNNMITVLVADPNFYPTDFRHARDALFNFNVCTEDHENFEFDTYMVPLDGRDWKWTEATLRVLNRAQRNEINIEPMVDGERRMTLIILPDDVDFDGHYGFAVLHYGLSVIRASEAMNPSSVIHELGHNFGMLHSGSTTDEYGDDRCLMGRARDRYVCFNGAKSYFMGLYHEYTAEFGLTPSPCQVTVDMVDLDFHLYARNKFLQIYDVYYVIVAVHVNAGKGMTEQLYMMYYSDEDIISVTKGEHGSIVDSAGNTLPYADESQRIADLAAGQSLSYHNVNIEREASTNMARVTITFDS